MLLLLAVGMAAIAILTFLLARPRAAILAYLLGLTFIPVWIGADQLDPFTVHTALALICLISIGWANRRETGRFTGTNPGLKTRAFDALLAALVLLTAGCFAVGVIDRGQLLLIFTWTLMYAVGRFACTQQSLAQIATILVTLLTIVALLALLEFATEFNPWLEFTSNSSSLFEVWGPQQYRGSFVRAEGSFGHSIALGLSLAIGIILSAATNLPTWRKLTTIGILSLTLVLTFSRTAFVVAGLGVLLLILFAGKRVSHQLRVGLGVMLLTAIPFGLLATQAAFAENSDESTDAALYRFWLLDLLPGLKPVGISDMVYRTTDGTTTIGAYQSIDSAAMLYALTNGWIPALILTLALVGAAFRLITRGGDAALIAIVALIPAFFTVALITQYAHLVWFLAGVAVSGLSSTPEQPPQAGTATEASPPVTESPPVSELDFKPVARMA